MRSVFNMKLLTRWTFRLTKYTLLLAVLVTLTVLVSIALARMERPDDLPVADNSQAIAIDNVHLIAMSGGEPVVEDQQVLVRNGVIEAILDAGSEVSAEFRVIDGRGGYLLPGLFEMHAHPIDRKYLALHLAHGVTSLRNMGGFPMHLRWREELVNGEWLGSNLFTASPTVGGETYSDPLTHKIVTDPAEVRTMVRRFKLEGWDLIKIYSGLSADVYEALIDEAQAIGLPVAGHVPYSVVAKDYALAQPMATLEHVEEIFQGPMSHQFDDERLASIAAQLKDMNATVTPTLAVVEHLTRLCTEKTAFLETIPLEFLNPLGKFFTDQTSGARWLAADEATCANNARRYAYFRRIVEVLHRHGVNMVLGSDNGAIYTIPGRDTLEEVKLMNQSGVPMHDVLRMATINSARSLGVENRLGSLEVGKEADMVLVSANPLSDVQVLERPMAVIKRGQWLGEDAINALKASARNPSSFLLTLGRVLEFSL
jgi:imidazolonepropionase-like amidohydrolase